jgi:hypothetical protein
MRFGFPLKSLSSPSGLESSGGVNCDSSGRRTDRVDGAGGIRFAKGNEILLVREAESQQSVGRGQILQIGFASYPISLTLEADRLLKYELQ